MARDSLCEQCPLSKYMGKKEVPVFQNGSRAGAALFQEVGYRGNTRSQIVVVGEPPEPVDLLRNEYMAGENMRLVDQEFRRAGIDPTSLFYAGATRCNVFGKKDMSTKDQGLVLSSCKPPLDRALKLLKPKLIVCMGGDALKQVTKQTGITQKRGKLVWSKEYECWVFPIFGPGYVKRDEKNFAHWRPDIAQLAQIIRSGFKPITAEETGDYRDVESLQFLLDKTGITVGLDTETQGNDWADPNSVVISYSVSEDTKSGYNIWLCRECAPEEADHVIKWERKVGKTKQIVDVPVKREPDYDRRIAELRELCRRPDIRIVMMNGNYDLHRLRQLGIPREQVAGYTLDVQSAAHLLDPDNFKGASLLNIQNAFLPGQADHKTAFGAEVDKGDMLAAALADPKRHTNYSAADTAVTLGCANVLRGRLLADKELARYYATLSHPIESRVLYTIEKNGIMLDLPRLPEVQAGVAAIMREKESAFLALVPQKIKDAHADKGLRLTRGDLIKDVLYSRHGFGLKPLEKTPGGDPSTNKKVLIRHRDALPDGHPAVEAISLLLEWGPYKTLFGTFLKGFEKHVKCDGRIHTQISKTFTATGRTGSRNPNLQNVPKRNKAIMKLIRSLLKAPPGKKLIAIDYSQAELRWIAHDSGDKEFTRVYRAGEDIHLITGLTLAEMSGLDVAKLTKDQIKEFRQKAKAANFGLSYGQSAKGFMNYARDEYGVHLTLEESEKFRVAFFRKYADLEAWHARRIREAQNFGFVRTDYGAIRLTPNIHSGENYKRAEDERVAVNTPIQSSSNDSALLAALEGMNTGVIDDNIAKLVLFVHDELIFEVDEDRVDIFVPQILEVMQNLPTRRMFGFDLAVPFLAEASVGSVLSEMSEYKVEAA